MSNNDVWVVLSMQQTLGRPFCEELSENNWRCFGVPTHLPQPFVSAAQQREFDSKILLSFEITGTVTQLSAAQTDLCWVPLCFHRREKFLNGWLSVCSMNCYLPVIPTKALPAKKPSITLVALIYKEQHPHFHINKLKLYSTHLKPHCAVHKDLWCMQFLSQLVARVRRTCT